MFFTILAIIAKVLLTILKILLFLFVFLVFVIGLILFVPVRYKAAGRYYENEKTFKLCLSWMLHIVSFRVESDGREVSYILRIFGVKVFPGKQKREKKNSVRKKKSKVKKKEKSKQKPVEEKNSEKSETLQIEEQRVDSAQIKDNQKKEIKSEQDNKTDKENKFSKNQKEETGKSKKIFDKILTIIKKVSGFFKNLINNIKSLINTAKKMLLAIKAGSEKAKLVKEFVLCDESRNMVCFVRDNMLHLWRHVKPKYLYTDITFGFDNPELTGKVLGAAAAFCAMAGFKPGLTPDFEQSILEGKIEVKGRITFVVLLKIAIRVWLSEEVKSFRKEYNNIREVL